MTVRPAVSVIVSTHNRAQYLPECLATLAEQDCQAGFEVVVIDNGSSDDTPSVLREWCRDHPLFRTATEPRLGLSLGKNAGIRLARGELLLFTDDDMIVDRGWIQAYCDFFARMTPGLVVAGGPYLPIPSDLKAWPEWFEPGALTYVGRLHYGSERLLLSSEYVWGGNMGAPRGVFDRLGFWDESVGRRGDERGTFEDVEYQQRAREAGGEVWFCPDAIVHHRIDRRTITARQVTSLAVTYGRNRFWAQSIERWGDAAAVPPRGVLGGLGSIGKTLSMLLLRATVFRLIPTKDRFKRLQHAAVSFGMSFERALCGHASAPLYRGIERLAFRASRVLLRVTRDRPDRPASPFAFEESRALRA